MTDHSDTPAKSRNHGTKKQTQSASLPIVKPMEPASATSSQRKSMKRSSKLSPKDIHVRLIFTIGVIVAITFSVVCLGLLWTFSTVTQPLKEQAPNDQAIISLLSTIVTFIAGSLGGILASNGFKTEPKKPEEGIPDENRD